ncbi:Dynein light chain Tctex-type [Clydaea vesicula]|uniref:Trafficking protein particle complex subunit 2-like protein n=1 Tax=Clydaea vesicula TaxID=447962 RepID=A0AAD5TWJ6_9FUNG|nr:Dynein light chain Tctex-type [Clydaea vesicula]
MEEFSGSIEEKAFVVDEVNNIIKESIENTVQNAAYHHNKVAQWNSNVLEQTLKKLTGLNKPFKYIVTVTIMQKNGAGLHAASSCYWDNSSDVMVLTCVSLIGKQNNLLFIKTFSPSYDQLKYHYLCHTACDVIDERVASSLRHTNDLYLGLLYSMDDLAVFGYMTNTRIKFLIVLPVSDSVIKDQDMKNKFRRIHNAYIGLCHNPFFDQCDDKMINSKRFSNVIDEIANF